MGNAPKKSMLARLHDVWLAGLDDFWPRDQVTDVARWRELGWREDHADEYCPRCGATSGAGAASPNGCRLCFEKSVPWNRIARVCVYAEPLRHWIWQFKYHNHWAWSRVFGKMIARAICDAQQADASRATEPIAPMPTYLAYVPLHRFRRWRRGYNQAALLAEQISKIMHWPVLPILRRKRYTRHQISVGHKQRMSNVKRAMAIDDIDLTGCHVWLIDDVKTTGSTLGECVRLLRQSGAEVSVAVIAVARSSDEPPLRHQRALEPQEPE